MTLADAGDHLEGVDSFVSPGGNLIKSGKDAFALRFHLHPNVRASVAGDQRGARLESSDGERWEFATDALAIAVEESILLSDTRGNRRATQLVLYGRVQQTASVGWHLYRTAVGARRLRHGSQEEPARA